MNQHKTSHPSLEGKRAKLARNQLDSKDLNSKLKKKPKRYNRKGHPKRTANNLSNMKKT